jgi:protoporphyrinogen oxidase
MNARTSVVVLGAGPAGLGAAFQLARRGSFDVTVIERSEQIGGNAGSFDLAGIPVDFGSHRLHPSCSPQILEDIRAMLGEGLLDRPRHGRIRLRGRWVHFPLKPADLALHLPPSFMLGVLRDAAAKLGRRPAEDSFAAVLERGLGRTICRDFYFPYARKIWGAAPRELDAEQARRRVQAGSLGKLFRKVLRALPGRKNLRSRFFYPQAGFGAISRAYYCAALKAGARIRLRTSVTGLEVEDGKAVNVHIRGEEGDARLPARQVLSTIPLSALVRSLKPEPPPAVLDAAGALQFRAMILIYLVLETDRFTEYDAHYFPNADVAITRLSEPKNYSLTGKDGLTVLCAELPCSPADSVWRAQDNELGALVTDALAAAGLPVRVPVREVVTRRLPQAYPIYTRDYRDHFDRLDAWVSGIEGLVTFGRQGLFAHDNTHHTLAMAYALNDCLSNSGELDKPKWLSHREAFQRHVVED